MKKEYIIIGLLLAVFLIYQDRQNKASLATMQAHIDAQNQMIARLQVQPVDNLPREVEILEQNDPGRSPRDPDLPLPQDNLSQDVEIAINIIPISPTATIQPDEVAPQPAPGQPSQPGAGPQLPQYGDISPPSVSPPGDGEVTAQNLTTIAEAWVVIKQMIVDLGLWAPAQTIFSIVIVVSVVFIILSYFKA